jgi:putative membrane protein
MDVALTPVVAVFALLTAAAHAVVFLFEGVLLRRPAVHRGVFGMTADDVGPARLWAFGVSFYNLFLAIGLVWGVVAWGSGDTGFGRTLVLYHCVFIALAGVALLAAGWMGLYRERRKAFAGAAGQSGPPLLALVAMFT